MSSSYAEVVRERPLSSTECQTEAKQTTAHNKNTIAALLLFTPNNVKKELKWESAVVRLAVQKDLKRTRSCLSTDCRKVKKKEKNGSLHLEEKTGIRGPTHGFAGATSCRVC